MPILVADAVSVTYPNGLEALRGFTLDVARGEFVAIVGPSGCGKSTLLRTFAGLLKPGSGRVTFDGEVVARPSNHVSLLFQEPALLPWRTVASNIQLPLEVGSGKERALKPGERHSDAGHQARISELIELVGLAGFEHAYPRELSGGMAQRAALARALITRPPVLLLDEPFGALDAFTRESLTAALEGIWRAAHTTGILVTHSVRESIFVADRVVICTPRPGQVAGIVSIDLPRPRSWDMESWPEFAKKKTRIRALLGL